MSPLALLLLAGAPAAPVQEDAAQGAEVQTPPRLPAALAWLEDQDDYPRVSRHLMVLEPGAERAETALDGLLYSFDAADHQRVAWCGDLLLVNGARPRSRPSPNVDLPLTALRRTDGGWQPVAPWQRGISLTHFAPAPGGDGVLVWSFQRVGFLPAGETRADAVRWLLTPDALGRAQVRAALWSADGRSLHVSVIGARKQGMEGGLWRIAVDRRDDGAVDGFGTAERVDDARGWPRRGWPDGGLLTVVKNGRDFYASRSLLHLRPGTDHAPRTLVRDLHANESFAVEPMPPGPSDRLPRPPRVAYARDVERSDDEAAPGGRIALRTESAEGEVVTREPWTGPRPADGLTWSPDGRWLAFHARDADRRPWVWVLEVATGEAHRLGPGLRPAWGPLAR